MAQVDLTEVINTGRFDFERARQAPGWLKEIRGEHVPETIEYGITSFTYKARRPFHPARLCEWTNIHFILEQPVFGDPMMEGGVKGPSEIEDGVEENSGDLESKTEATGSSTAAATAVPAGGEDVNEDEEEEEEETVFEARDRVLKLTTGEYGQVLRSKGFFWMASRNSVMGEWGQAGVMARVECGGMPWFADLPAEAWPDDEETVRAIRKDFQGAFGDRRQELVIIGVGLKEAALRASLDACLLTDEEMAMTVSDWASFDDPWAEWPTAAELLGEDDEDDGDVGTDAEARLKPDGHGHRHSQAHHGHGHGTK